MASAMTITGLDELLKGADAFGPAFDQAAEAVALSHGHRVQTRAQAILKSKVRGNPVVITVTSDRTNRQVLVEADAASGQPTELHLWLEYGTAPRRQKSGRRTGQINPVRYMRQAVSAEQTQYPKDVEAALDATIAKTFGS